MDYYHFVFKTCNKPPHFYVIPDFVDNVDLNQTVCRCTNEEDAEFIAEACQKLAKERHA